MRHQRAIDQRVAGRDVVAGVHAEVLAVAGPRCLAFDAAFAAGR